MRKTLVIVGSALLAYLVLSFALGSLLGLTGTKLWILRIALWLIGVLAAAVVVWFFSRKEKEEQAAASPEEAPTGGEEIAVLIRDAERKLAAAQLAKGARTGNLPAILLLGETSSTKTSIVLHSGLEPELLAGQVYQDGNVTATRSANLWFSRRTLFVEAGGKLLDDQAARSYLVRRLQPRKLASVMGGSGQAPRAVLICMEAERLTAGTQAITTMARNLRTRLGEIAGLFGIQLPVYVLFTKTDRLPFFADFVRNLTKEEVTQPLGVTLPIPGQTSGIYSEEQTARLGGAFDQIFRALCDARPEFLARENDATKLPGAYEFPREFRKLRGSLVQFLLDLCRPSELAVGPFLRGFYFSGVRPVTIQEAAPAPEVRAPDKASLQGAREATGMFRVQAGGEAAAPAPQRMAVSRRVPQWLFLTRLFSDVLLADRVAMGASGSSAKADVLRRILLIIAAVFALVFCIGFTVSFILNRGLESEVNQAAHFTAAPPAGTDLASVESLRHLEGLRQSLMTLTTYNREGAPLRYRWGLYIGDELYPEVRRIYFKRFRTLLFAQTQSNLVTFLDQLPPTPGPAYDPTYNSLKAYLITTSNHDKSLREWLSPVLQAAWAGTQTVDPERTQLAARQFDFYSDELKLENPYSKQNDAAVIQKARIYLTHFGDLDRVYQNIKSKAPKTSINFNRQFPGSAAYVIDGYEVAGPFTKQGWEFMTTAFRRPDQYAKGEPWVLGDQTAAGINDHGALRAQLEARYQADFIAQWSNYLKSAKVVPYKNVKDASEKLSKLSGNDSPLLALLSLASQNTSVGDDVAKKTFQPPQTVVPAGSERYIGGPNQEYINALTKLQASVEGVTKAADPNDPAAAGQTMTDADAARLTTKQLSQSFNPDPQNHVDSTVQALLLEPITNVEALLRGLGPAELNGKGKDLCSQFRTTLSKYPFNPAGKLDATVSEVNGLLGKPDGALWAFYEANLKKVLQKKDNAYVAVPGNVKLTAAFVTFFNTAAAFSDALYAGSSPDPKFSYSLRALPTEGVQKLGLDIDGQKLDFTGATVPPKVFNWQGSGAHGVRATVGSEGFSFFTNDTVWAAFRFFGAADHSEHSPGGGELLDWIPRSGSNQEPMRLPNGKPLTIRFELNMGPTPHVFEKGYFGRLACVAEVAQP